MALKWKFFTGILIVVLIIIAIIRFMPEKTSANLFMAVDGDPRMRICQMPKDGKLASPQVLEALKITKPLTIHPENKAEYRISILRPPEQKSIVISFYTPIAKKDNGVQIGVYENGKLSFENANLSYEQAASLVNSFEDAGIWGPLKPTIKPRDSIIIPAEAIIEIAAPNLNKCVVTRYDDERINELLSDFDFRLSAVIKKVSIEGFLPPDKKLFGKDYGTTNGKAK